MAEVRNGRVSADTYRQYAALRLAGASRADACASAGINLSTGVRFDTGHSDSRLARTVYDEMCLGQFPFTEFNSPAAVMRKREELGVAGMHEHYSLATKQDNLTKDAKRALSDFEYFRRRYLGRVTLPWHVRAAEDLVSRLTSMEKEYVVLNVPPGTGKTTLIHDIAAWTTTRNRAIRGLFGSATQSLAMSQTRRLRKTLERTSPYEAKDADKQRGLACDAVATLEGDFGVFKSPSRDRWRDDEFVVVQYDGAALGDKETTWSSYGQDSQVIGFRFDLIFWDDLVTKKMLNSTQVINQQREWFDDEAVTRLDPGGLLVVIGQRLGPRDLYRYLLDKKIDPYSTDVIDANRANAQYHHILFRAHDDDKCTGQHETTAPAQPDGCLLDPKRLTWKELNSIKSNDARKYEVVYQQRDEDPQSATFDQAWIYGGQGRDGLEYGGSLDHNRGLWEVPDGVRGLGIMTVDPSPTNWWAVQTWLYQAPLDLIQGDRVGGTRWLLDTLNMRMSAPEFLDFNYDAQRFTGILEDCRLRYLQAGHKLRYVVFEVNAAQRWVTMYEHAKRWCSQHAVKIVPHTTTGHNKLDADYGVSGLGAHYQFGRYRLPFAESAKPHTRVLIDQLLGKGDSDDQIMANWFLEAALPSLFRPTVDPTPQWRPTWLSPKR